jgi:hypothetical protein
MQKNEIETQQQHLNRCEKLLVGLAGLTCIETDGKVWSSCLLSLFSSLVLEQENPDEALIQFIEALKELVQKRKEENANRIQ